MVFDSLIAFYLAHKDTLFLKIIFLFSLKISRFYTYNGKLKKKLLKKLKSF